MFLDNKYTKWYYSIIANPIKSNDAEVHHIIPRSLGGSEEPSNLVLLSLKQHYVVHLLLIRMLEVGPKLYKMLHALKMMSKTRKGLKTTARLYEIYKIKYKHTCTKIYYYNEELDKQIWFYKEEEYTIPEGYVKGGKPKSKEHREKLGQYDRTDEWKEQQRKNSSGKKHYTNDITGEAMCVPESEAPVGEGWRNGTSTKGTPKESYTVYVNPEKTEKIFVFEGDIPPDGWVKGYIQSEKQIIARKNKDFKSIGENISATKKKKKSKMYHNLETGEQKGFAYNEIVPDGWIKGAHPKNICSGYTQSDKQKQRAKEANQSRYEVIYLDGRVEIITGQKDFIKSLGVTKMQFGYRRELNRLYEYGIKSFTLVS